eukprot:scaffold327057_cov25-Prasinocladus_malaysianus.AAC.1
MLKLAAPLWPWLSGGSYCKEAHIMCLPRGASNLLRSNKFVGEYSARQLSEDSLQVVRMYEANTSVMCPVAAPDDEAAGSCQHSTHNAWPCVKMSGLFLSNTGIPPLIQCDNI